MLRTYNTEGKNKNTYKYFLFMKMHYTNTQKKSI